MDMQVRAPVQAVEILRIIDILLRALGTKLLCILALLVTAGLFGWSMWKGNLLALMTACAFAIAVLWPVLAVAFLGRVHHESSADHQ